MDRAPNLLDFSGQTRETPERKSTGSDYKEIAREVLARIDKRLADLDDTPPYPSEPRFREFPETVRGIMNTDDEAVYVRRAWRGLIGLLLAASLVAAISFLWSHSEAAVRDVAQLLSGSGPDSTVPADKPEPGPQPVPPATPKAIAEAAPAPAAPLPRTAPDPESVKPGPAPVPPELTELMRKVDRNIAGLAQAVTELRLAQQQVAGDNAKVAEDIRASLDQMARAMVRAPEPARVSEQQARVPEQQVRVPEQQTRVPEQQARVIEQARAPEQASPPKPPAPTSRATAPRNRKVAPTYRMPIDALESELLR
jgi:hypothetical protein